MNKIHNHPTIYEFSPHWRTITVKEKTWSPSKGFKFITQKHYLYFPYMQFMFYKPSKTFLSIFASKEPFPAPSIFFLPPLLNPCLGDTWNLDQHDHNDTISKFWLTTFDVTNSDYMFKQLITNINTNMYNTTDENFCTTKNDLGMNDIHDTIKWIKQMDPK